MGFRSVTEAIDTTTAGGRLVFHLFGALAKFERQLIRDRTVAGLAAARARGRVGGRPRSMTAAKLRVAVAMRAQDPPVSLGVIARELGLSKTTVARNLADAADSDAATESSVAAGEVGKRGGGPGGVAGAARPGPARPGRAGGPLVAAPAGAPGGRGAARGAGGAGGAAAGVGGCGTGRTWSGSTWRSRWPARTRPCCSGTRFGRGCGRRRSTVWPCRC